MHQDEFNKILHEYILTSIYTSKIEFLFFSAKVKKFEMDKQKGRKGVKI